MKAAFWVTFTGTAAMTLLLAGLSDRSVATATRGAASPASRPVVVTGESRVELRVEPSSVVRIGPRPQPERHSLGEVPKAPAPPPPDTNMEREFLTSVVLPGSDPGQRYESQQLLPHSPIRPKTHIVNTINTGRNLAEALSASRSREAESVIATLEQYARAWNEKDAADIRAIRPGLERRTVKEELAGARSILMRIHPVSEPKIEGDRAIVECLHRVDQVFDDGTEKQSPGVRLTYVLVKRGGSWLIADSR